MLSALVVWLVAGPAAASAQSLRAHAPDRISAGGQAAVYVEWTESDAFQGGVLRLPQGWDLMEARWAGSFAAVEVRARTLQAPGVWQLIPEASVDGQGTLILRVRAAERPGRGAWSFTPYRLERPDPTTFSLIPDAGLRIEHGLVAAEPARTENRSLHFETGGRPVMLTADALPTLDADAAFTVEAWMRTSHTDQVVMSAWDGQEQVPYAIELVVDERGHLVFYQGMPGDHRALRSLEPVAQGTWHHVAMTHDPERGWARLLVDGIAQDSVRHVTPLQRGIAPGLALAARPGDEQARFSGEIDELRVWAVARTPSMVRSTLFRQLPQPAVGATFLSFDEAIPRRLLADGTRAPRPRRTDLTFSRGITDLGVQQDESGVTLSWALQGFPDGRFLIERSEDGSVFEQVGTLSASAGITTLTGASAYSFRHDDVQTLAFYRIRHQRRSGPEHVSHAVKVGRNEQIEKPRLAVLDGSFPNPFNPRTTIHYELKEGQDVSVSVWDLSGQRVAMLWSGFQEAGRYEVPFSADQLPSGTYFVRLASPEGVQSHPILLMK